MAKSSASDSWKTAPGPLLSTLRAIARRNLPAIVFGGLALAMLAWVALIVFVGDDSVLSGQEWGYLHEIAQLARQKGTARTSRMIVEHHDGYWVAGVQAPGGGARTWIMLNPRYGFLRVQMGFLSGVHISVIPRIKVLGDPDYTITTADYRRCRVVPGITGGALHELQRHVR